MLKDKIQTGFLVGFMLLLFLPGIVWLKGWKERTISFENKKLADLPVLKLSHLDPFPTQYENWYNDHFPARNSLIYLNNFLSARYLLKSPKPSMAIIGHDGWLYMANNEMNTYTGKFIFEDYDLKLSLEELKYRQQACAQAGAEYRIVIIPSKQSVYPEFLPSSIHKYSGPNATDQLITYVRQHSSLQILDLRPAMIENKKYGQLFIKGDNHWNALGAFLAYREIVNWLRPVYKLSAALDLSDVVVKDTLQRGGNILEVLGLAEDWKDMRKKIIPKKPLPFVAKESVRYPCPSKFPYGDEYQFNYQNRDTTLPGLLVIRESFATDVLRKFLSAHFGKSTYIWDNWEHGLNDTIIKAEKPKLVLCIVLESMIDCFENHPDKPSLKKNP